MAAGNVEKSSKSGKLYGSGQKRHRSFGYADQVKGIAMRAMSAKFAFLTVAGLTLAHSAATNAAPANGWAYVGTTHAKHFNDHDTLVVNGPNNVFRELKIGVKGASLHVQRLVVTYGNGLMDDVPVNYKIPKDGESKPIPMKYGKREVKKIDFWYDTKGWLHGTAAVSVYGRR
ncbi:hypothetical protein WBP06_09605 [Novosphingobium sp. BL-8H]|uniref:DUF2541 family protein n=1 Tax=Novosphingobium sp. BL-8H TaxID=3127640 RepID=UPI0037576226